MESSTPPAPAARRRPNARGQGERLREEIVAAAMRMLDALADDEALSLRAVAREVSIAATSVYLHFPDRDALVLAVLRRCNEELVRTGDEADAAHEDPAARLRARILAQTAWAHEHPGLYKVLHERGPPAARHAVQGGAGRQDDGGGPALHGRRRRPA